MDITQWYAVALGGIFAAYVVIFLLQTVSATTGPKARSQVLKLVKKLGRQANYRYFKHLYYPQVHRYLRGSEKTTRLDLLVIMVFLVGIVACTAVQVQDISGLRRRSGLISIINLIPLSLGSHMNFIINLLGIRLGTYSRIHRWLGRITIAEGLIHTAAAVSLERPDLRIPPSIAGLIAAITMVVVLFSSASTIRQRFYEIFVKLHFILGTTLLAMLFVHSNIKKPLASPTIYLLAAVCTQISIGALRLGQVLYRNVKTGEPLSRASLRTIIFKRESGRDIPVFDAVHLHVRSVRSWRPRAGQYVYLCIPGLGHTSLAQSHPFYVSWWYTARGHDYMVFVIQRRKGFTQDLLLYASTSNSPDQDPEILALVEGPYGNELNLESYETVLLFATGIGIVGQIPYMKQLLAGSQNGKVKTQKIALFWEMDFEIHAAWVADMMKELLLEDVNRILDIKLFVLGRFLSIDTQRGDDAELGERIKVKYEAMDAENLISAETQQQRGRTVVSLCTNDETGDKIREIVRGMLGKDIHLKELEFRPASCRGNGVMVKDMRPVGGLKSREVAV